MVNINVGSIPAGNVKLCGSETEKARTPVLRLIRSLPFAHPRGLRPCCSTPVGSIRAGNDRTSGSDLVKNGAQLVEIDRLDQVKIEACFFAAADVLVCAKAG
jgi:hypothetical protein